MKISVNIACYNAQKYLGKCLDSLVSQTLNDIEINCVDNNSTDGTVPLIKSYQERYSNINLVSNLVDLSLSGSRKAGVLSSSCDYVMLIDADDWLESNACEVLYNLIDSKGVDIVEFDCKLVDKDGVIQERDESYCKYHDGYMQNDEIFESLSSNTIGQMTWNKIYKREIVEKVYMLYQVNELFHKEDVLFTNILYKVSSSYFGTPEKLYNYRIGHGGSANLDLLGRSRIPEICFNLAVAYKQLDSFGEFEADLIIKKVNKWMNDSLLSLVGSNLDDEQYEQGLELFLKSWGGGKLIPLIRSDDNSVIKVVKFWLNCFINCLAKIDYLSYRDNLHYISLVNEVDTNNNFLTESERLRCLELD